MSSKFLNLLGRTKMALKIELVSKEIIKPSSPTPNHLKNLKFSFLDQIAPPIYACTTVFFDAQTNPNPTKPNDFLGISRSLKNSLSRTLSRYYPFAGKVTKDFTIDCNDQGVEFTDARVSCRLSEIKRHHDAHVLKQFLPFDPNSDEQIESGKVLAVQFNYFDCGGFVIGVCVTHKIVDANSMFTLVNAWAATSRGDVPQVTFESATHFPPIQVLGFNSKKGMSENIVSTRLIFDEATIESLKRKASSEEIKNPTRVEVVTAFIWRRTIAIALSKAKSSGDRPKLFLGVHMVNLRSRMDPPLPNHAIGNMVRPAFAPVPVDDNTKLEDLTLQTLVPKLRSGIKQIDTNYIKNLQKNEQEYFNSIKRKIEMYTTRVGEVEALNFSSLGRFGANESDFGWGNPVWVGIPTSPYKNMIVLMAHNGEGGGIEAWVDMTPEDRAVFEADPELRPFVSSTIIDATLKSKL